jgi:hypothetical protein
MPDRPNNFWEVLFKSAGQAASEFPEYNQQISAQNRQRRLDQFNMSQEAKRTELQEAQFALRQDESRRDLLAKLMQGFQQKEKPEDVFWWKYRDDLSKAPEGDLLRYAPDLAEKYYPSTLDKANIQRAKELHDLDVRKKNLEINKLSEEVDEGKSEKGTEKIIADMIKSLGTQTKQKTTKTDEGNIIEEVPMFGVPQLKARADSLATAFLKQKTKPRSPFSSNPDRYDKARQVTPEPEEGTLEWELKRRGLQ